MMAVGSYLERSSFHNKCLLHCWRLCALGHHWVVWGAGTHLESLTAWLSWQGRGVLGMGMPPMTPMSITLQGAQHPCVGRGECCGPRAGGCSHHCLCRESRWFRHLSGTLWRQTRMKPRPWSLLETRRVFLKGFVFPETCMPAPVLPRETPWAAPGSCLPTSPARWRMHQWPVTQHLLPVLHARRWDVTRPQRLQRTVSVEAALAQGTVLPCRDLAIPGLQT